MKKMILERLLQKIEWFLRGDRGREDRGKPTL